MIDKTPKLIAALLLVDILSFTLILPLFAHLMHYYHMRRDTVGFAGYESYQVLIIRTNGIGGPSKHLLVH